jgi:hypothetical protein
MSVMGSNKEKHTFNNSFLVREDMNGGNVNNEMGNMNNLIGSEKSNRAYQISDILKVVFLILFLYLNYVYFLRWSSICE